MGTLVYSFDMPHMVHVVFQPLPDDLPNVQDDFVDCATFLENTTYNLFFALSTIQGLWMLFNSCFALTCH